MQLRMAVGILSGVEKSMANEDAAKAVHAFIEQMSIPVVTVEKNGAEWRYTVKALDGEWIDGSDSFTGETLEETLMLECVAPEYADLLRDAWDRATQT